MVFGSGEDSPESVAVIAISTTWSYNVVFTENEFEKSSILKNKEYQWLPSLNY